MLQLSHKKLEVYNFSLKIVDEVYKITRSFPREEIYVLVSQIRRAAISVSSNIAEGAARVSKKEKRRYYEVARSSVVELDTQFEIAFRQNYTNTKQCVGLEANVLSTFRMLSKMIENLTDEG